MLQRSAGTVAPKRCVMTDGVPWCSPRWLVGFSWVIQERGNEAELWLDRRTRARTFWTRPKEASIGESVNVSGFVFPQRPWPVPPFWPLQQRSATFTPSPFKVKKKKPHSPVGTSTDELLTHTLSPLMSHHRPRPPTPQNNPESLLVCLLIPRFLLGNASSP